jgi:hypothetical protein
LRFGSGREWRDTAFEGFDDFALEAVAAHRPAASLPGRRNKFVDVRLFESQPVFVLPLRSRRDGEHGVRRLDNPPMRSRAHASIVAIAR